MSSFEPRRYEISRKPVANTYGDLRDSKNGFTSTIRPVEIIVSDVEEDEQYLHHQILPEEQHDNLSHNASEGILLQALVASFPNEKLQATSADSQKNSKARSASSYGFFFEMSGAPVTMLASLTAGLLIAVAHHKMNTSLQGQIVLTFGSWTQQWTSLYGIALAFLVKTSFAICAGAAFIQRLWLNFSTHHRPVRVKDFDTVTGSLGNLFSLFGSFIWIKHPLLLLMVSISWSMPMAAIFTPGTLSVTSQSFNTTSAEQVPQLSFNSSSYLVFSNYSGTTQPIWENTELTKVAFATATSANILGMVPSHANSSYTLEFFGPALKCRNANESQILAASTYEGGEYGYLFAAYTGSAPWDGNNSSSSNDYNWAPLDISDMTGNSASNETDGNSIWVLSQLGQMVGPTAIVNLTECRLQNASYNVNFTFINSAQSTVVNKVEYINPSYLTGVYSGNEGLMGHPNVPRKTDIIFSYKAILSAFGNILVGSQRDDPRTTVMPEKTHYNLLNIDFTRSEATANGLQDLFQNITLGLFSNALFLANATAPINVTVTTWSTVYTYDPTNLFIAYGAAFLCSLICCSIGLQACLISKGSYRNAFSTHIRAAYQSNLSPSLVVEQHDRPMDPAPVAFKRKLMVIGDRNENSE